MDKYTVDLDQVLNDFEYSELTDQHEQTNKPNNKPPPYVHNSFKNTNVKHSINNVFHSLNEYLNTDISPKCEIKQFVQPEPSISGENSKFDNNITLQNTFTPKINNIKSGINNNVETAENHVSERPNKVENGEKSVENEETINDDVKDVAVNDDVKDIAVNDDVKDAAVNVDVKDIAVNDDVRDIAVNDDDKDVPVSDDVKDVPVSDDVSDVPVNDDVKDVPVSDDVEDLTINSVDDDVTEPIAEQESRDEETSDSSSESDETDRVALIETIDESIKQKTDLTNERVLENKGNDEETIEENEDLPEKTEDDGVIRVGFDEELDLDESELNKYLDELEKEYETEINPESEDGCEKEPVEEEEKIEEEEETKTEENPRPNNLPLPNQDGVDENKPVIDLVGEPGSTPYNNVYIDEELPPPSGEKPKVENSDDTECSTSASPTFSDISTETNSSCTPSTDTVNDEEEKKGEAPAEAPPPPANESEWAGPEAGDPARSWLGKRAPLWIPDADATGCLHCETKFTVIKRRHHCRACGYVLCSKCCNLRYRLEYLEDVARVCNRCHEILSKAESSSGSESGSPKFAKPNPNNPAEYCSTVPPHQQVSAANAAPPSVMVPVGVLKRKGSNKARTNKSVMFCDGIRPGSDLTNLDNDFGYAEKRKGEEAGKGADKGFPLVQPETGSFIPKGDDLPPTVTFNKTDVAYCECSNGPNVVEMLKNETLIFALQTNLFVHLKIINMECCVNKTAWCFSTEGLINVGQDEVVILLELLDDEKTVPKDIFLHINNIYMDALKGNSVKEMGISLHNTSNFLGSKNHAGFVFIRPTFQCLQNVIKPKEPYLIGILIHRWETPWAKLFPLRLVLRLGAEYRYYPSPIISNRHRDSVFVEIGHTIINLLADFRNFSYTLPQIRGLTIHMEEKNTTVTIPVNRYDQVMKSMNNSSDHILAFAGNFSSQADSHLVCIQDTQSNENAYSTHAINIHNKPRKVTGASFIVFNGALKSSSGLTAKSSIVEDGLMIQVPSEHMNQIRESLRNMKNHTIQCGCINAASDETVNIIWGEPDVNFNVNVFSPIDNKSMEGIPSIRVHNGKDYVNGNRLIRWTEVFIIQNEGEASRNQDPIDISKVSETIAKATCTALVKYLDLLVSNNFYKIGIRANLNAYFVAYSAGSNATKLPPIYMESLDNELVPVLHRNVTNDCEENTIILELIFRILNK